MHNTTIAIFGGSGFVGRHLVKHLAEKGATLKVGVRHPRAAQHLLPMGYPGQILIHPINICSSKTLHGFLKDVDCVINLVGTSSERGQTFLGLHVQGVTRVAQEARKANVKSLVHFSCLGATEYARCPYARTKGIGEQRVREAFPSATIIRPSLIFGAEDSFFNSMARVACLTPILFLPKNSETLYQPVFVRDVAEATIKILEKGETSGIYELAGSQIYRLADLILLTLQTIERKRLLVHLPESLGHILGKLVQRPACSANMIPSYQEKLFQDLSVAPANLEIILPTYLNRFKPKP